MKKDVCFRCALNGDDDVPATKVYRLFGDNEIPLCDACFEFWNRDMDEDGLIFDEDDKEL